MLLTCFFVCAKVFQKKKSIAIAAWDYFSSKKKKNSFCLSSLKIQQKKNAHSCAPCYFSLCDVSWLSVCPQFFPSQFIYFYLFYFFAVSYAWTLAQWRHWQFGYRPTLCICTNVLERLLSNLGLYKRDFGLRCKTKKPTHLDLILRGVTMKPIHLFVSKQKSCRRLNSETIWNLSKVLWKPFLCSKMLSCICCAKFFKIFWGYKWTHFQSEVYIYKPKTVSSLFSCQKNVAPFLVLHLMKKKKKTLTQVC